MTGKRTTRQLKRAAKRTQKKPANRPPSATTGGLFTGSPAASGMPPSDSNSEYVPTDASLKELIQRWYVQPLKAMGNDQGFILLEVLFPLYEKHLRVSHSMPREEAFSQGHRIFRVICSDLGMTYDGAQDDVYIIWNHIRNGLLHRAMPRHSDEYTFALVRIGPGIHKEGNHYWVNPFALRDILLPHIEADRNMWKEDEFPLAKEFRELSES